MADGAGIGIGTGIGHALSEIGAGISRKNEIELGLRDKQITALEKNMSQQGYKLQQALGGTYSPDALKNAMAEGSPNRDEVTTLFNELSNNVQRYNAYFPDSHPNMIADRVRRLMGKPPGQGRQSPLRTSVEQQMSQTAEAPAKSTAKDFREQWQERLGVLRDVYKQQLQNGTVTDQQLQIQALSPSGIAVSRVQYQDAQGTKYNINQNDPTEMQEVRDKGLTLVPKGGAGAAAKPGTAAFGIAKYLASKGLTPETATQQQYDEAVQHVTQTTDKTATGQMIRTEMDADPSLSYDQARDKVFNRKIAADRAKEAIANEQTSTMKDSDMEALVQLNLKQGNMTNPFPARQNPVKFNQYALKMAAEIQKQGPGMVMANQANVAGVSDSIKKNQDLLRTKRDSEETLNRNLEQVLSLSGQVSRGNSTLANDFLLDMQGKLGVGEQTSEYRAFRLAVETAIREYDNLTGSLSGAGGGTVSGREEARDKLSVAFGNNDVGRVVQQMRIDGHNAILGIQGVTQDLNEALIQLGGGRPQAQGQQPQRMSGCPEIGTVREGRDGNFRYIGGDCKGTAAWEKVQ